jgi:hypothetical protein
MGTQLTSLRPVDAVLCLGGMPVEPVTMAVAALVSPFLKELITAGRAAMQDGGQRAGAKLRAAASKVWDRLLGPDNSEPRLQQAAAAASADSSNTAAQQTFVAELDRVIRDLGNRDIRFIEAILKESEEYGGPRPIHSGELDMEVQGNNNNVIGQNTGTISINSRP